MNVLGIDHSSKATGLVLLDDHEVIDQALWEPPARATRSAELVDCEDSILAWVSARKIDVAVVEEPGGGGLGFRTARVMGQFEGAVLIGLERAGLVIRQIKVGQARNLVLGCKVTIKKGPALALAWEKFPFLEQYGEHITDAYIQAAAWQIQLRKGKA